MGRHGMNYAQSTDKDLNHRLLELIHGDVVNYWCLSDDETFIYDCGPIGEDFHKIELKDYCNDWNATMPLAAKHGISLKSPIKENKIWVAIWNEWGGIWTPNEMQVKNEFPLRAIVICLIKVLENE